MNKKQQITTLITFLLFLINIVNPSIQTILVIPVIAGGVGDSDWNNESNLSVQIINLAPRVNYYDFQENVSGNWESRLNQKIEVDNSSEYRFIVNVSSDQGWDDIEFINITAWYDNGTEATEYNYTKGGNFNLNFQYENTSGSESLRRLWPNNEITYTGSTIENVTDTIYGVAGTGCRNITFSFIPHCQFRYAAGDEINWDATITPVENTSKYALYNKWSWNFNISVTDSGEDNGNIPLMTTIKNEFGVYAYTEILSTVDPSIQGSPGNNCTASSNVSILTCTNGNYSLTVNITDLNHTQSSDIIDNGNVYVRGGNRSIFKSLQNSVYIYGGGEDGMPNSEFATAFGDTYNTSNIQYRCDIPIGTLAGLYTAEIRYHLKTLQ
ncbi:MAG: hypothetical protein DRN27_02855 [Thermoplasmata archaeon]|nr:MAG: hypothetical protein DRN27_02855 [Thermoplasmata archaeon]